MSGSSSANNNIIGINSANTPSNSSDTDILRQTPAQSTLNPVADPSIPSLAAPPGLEATPPEVAVPSMSHQRSATALPSLGDHPGLLTLSDILSASPMPMPVPAVTAPTSHRRYFVVRPPSADAAWVTPTCAVSRPRRRRSGRRAEAGCTARPRGRGSRRGRGHSSRRESSRGCGRCSSAGRGACSRTARRTTAPA